MDSSTLEKIVSGSRIFIDSTIFIYHFTGVSMDCRNFLERCERGDVKGISTVLVLAEVAHRLMMIEAVMRGLVKGANLPRKLRDMPEAVKQLHIYQDQIASIPLMGVDVMPVDSRSLLQSADLRKQYGFLMNDSLVATSAILLGTEGIASADEDFLRLQELRVFRPADLLSHQ